MPDHMTDAELVLFSLLHGVARWEPSKSSTGSGELCFNGIRHWINCDERGLPSIHVSLRRALIEEIHPCR